MENRTISIYSDSRRTNNRFFISPLIDVKNDRKAHHSQIIKVYQKWVDVPIQIDSKFTSIRTEYYEDLTVISTQEIDLTSFNPNKIQINIIGTVLPSDNKDNMENNSDFWALHHLKDYEQTIEKYNNILECQNNFNTQLSTFIDTNKEYLKRLISSNNIHEDKIESLLRYYLYKIVDEYSHPDSHE